MSKKTKKAKKSKLKSLFSKGEYEVPSIIRAQTIRGFIIGGGIVISGIIFAALTNHIYMAVFGLLLGVIISAANYLKEVKLSKTGYKTIEGICVKIEYPALGKGKRNKEPKRFLIAGYSDFYNDERIFSIPYMKGNELLEVNDKVIIYTNNNPAYYVSLVDKNGYIGIGGLLGYENNGFVTPQNDESEDTSDSTHQTAPNSDFFTKRY